MAKHHGRKGRPWRRLRERVRRQYLPCHLCGQPIDYDLEWPDPQSFTVDHIVPLSHAPELAHDIWNLAAAHLACNSAKSAGGGIREVENSEPW